MTNEKREMTNGNDQFLKNNIFKEANIKKLIEEPKEIKHPNWTDKNKFIKLLLTATNLITKIKQVNLIILTLKTWLIILKIIQLVKYLLKRFKCIKRNKKCRNDKI